MQPKKSSLSTLSNEALCNLRDEIADLLKSRAEDLRRELDLLSGGAVTHVGSANGSRNGSRATRKKVIPKYQAPDGQTWTGRGVKPRWLTSAINEGKQLTDFLIASHDKGSL